MRIALCAKSRWTPTVRREHAFASTAAAHGVDVVFVESPSDVRDLRASQVGAWTRSQWRLHRRAVAARVSVAGRATLVPGHRGRAAARVDGWQLGRQLAALHREEPLDAVVMNLPWQWDAVRNLPIRRVFDAADDWSALIPERADWMAECYRRVASSADRVVVASEALSPLFPGTVTSLVPNGVDERLSVGAPVRPPGGDRFAYLGTMSERLDVAFMSELLDRLPTWTLDLYGPCHYAATGARPDVELSALVTSHGRRVRWHGPVDRSQVPGLLDAADVLLIPHRRERSGGQSSMKMYDYAARGRPVISTRWDDELESRMAPGTALVSSATEAATAAAGACSEPSSAGAARVAWSQRQSWNARWPDWAEAVLGAGVDRLRPDAASGVNRV